jgi:signal transduction histidine kinase
MRQAVDSFNAMQARINRLLQERTHMIGAIAHDLRTPLTRLSFRLDGLPSPLGEKVDADIQEMKTMISAALDFIRDRSLGLHRQRLDMRLLVESVVDDLVDVGHDVTVQPGAAITLEGDPLALRRVVVNLVENGLKYGERVRLKLRGTGDGCVLEIDDDGPGIPDALQQQVFEPFFRLEASRNRDTGGIGLGLATVRAIVLDHGGTVTLRNRKDGGLRVAITLPAVAPAGT